MTIAYHPDLEQIGKQYYANTQHIEISRLSPLFSFPTNSPQQTPIADPYISRSPISLKKCNVNEGKNSWVLSKQNSSTHLAKASGEEFESLTLSEDQIKNGYTFILGGRIVLILHFSTASITTNQQDFGLIGVSTCISKVRELIAKVASLKMPVLIRGESGTGKELIAQAIHFCSPRNKAKLVSINMGAISKELVNAELFGSVKGAFTGAVSRKGCFLEANNSTLFLDEIGEAPLEVQVALLRALETGVIQAVGSQTEVPLNVRVVASTDANLEALIGQESFRMPLLQRLSGLVIEILPLRERREDIGCILLHFLKRCLHETGQLDKLLHCADEGKYYWAWFFARCSEFDWPGNVRQLKNSVSQLSVALMGVDDVSTFDWQGFVDGIVEQNNVALAARMALTPNSSLHQEPVKTQHRKPREISQDEVLEALKLHEWQIKLAADYLNISRTALYQKIDASDALRRASDIPQAEIKDVFIQSKGKLDKMVDQLKISKQALTRRLHEIGLIE